MSQQWIFPVVVLALCLIVATALQRKYGPKGRAGAEEARASAAHLDEQRKPIGYTYGSEPISPVVGYTSTGAPVTADKVADDLYNPRTVTLLNSAKRVGVVTVSAAALVAMISACSTVSGESDKSSTGPCAGFSAEPVRKAITDDSAVLKVVEYSIADQPADCVYYGTFGSVDDIISFRVTQGAINAATADANKYRSDYNDVRQLQVADSAYFVWQPGEHDKYFISKGTAELTIEVGQSAGHETRLLDAAAIALGKQL